MLEEAGPSLLDAFGRHLHYLRLSVTERCNFRCTYCLPHGCARDSTTDPLSLPELGRLVDGFVDLGFWKVRLTGGEPTVRSDIGEIVSRIAATRGVREVGLTTNGYRLATIAHELAQGGLSSLNVSVDSLDPERFAAITGCSQLRRVVAGVERALAAGIPRIKVNAVLLAGTAHGEVDRFLSWARDVPITIRFIELMPIGVDREFFERNHLATSEIEAMLLERDFTRLPRAAGGGPAIEYGRVGHRGRIGIIAPSRNGFCGSCNRLRVSSAGNLKLCLFDDRELPLRGLLQSDGQRFALATAVRDAVMEKPASHHLAEGRRGTVESLCAIGG
jgi:cyclic pyranopterin phosphate synthase